MSRPSHKELNKKLREARRILAQDSQTQIVILDRLKWTEEWDRLVRYLGLSNDDFSLWEDKQVIIGKCFNEITAEDHFWRGHRTFCQMRGYESIELWEFKWRSKAWEGKNIYTKFGFKNDKLCFLSFHPDEPERSKVK